MPKPSGVNRRTPASKKPAPAKKKQNGEAAAAELDETTDDPLRGMARSFAVLDLLATSPSRVVDVTRSLNLPWATVHRTLIQLEKAQFLHRNPETNRYEIGPRLWHIGSAYLANHRVLKAAMPYLGMLEAQKNVVAQVAERIGTQAVVIYSHQHAGSDITKAQYGYHFPLHCGSKGLALLAFQTQDFIDEYLKRDLERLTPDTMTDPGQIRAALAKVQAAGISCTVGDVQPHTGSMSAPIREASGQTIACASFVFRKTHIKNTDWYVDLQEKMLEATHSISIDLGWRPDRRQHQALRSS